MSDEIKIEKGIQMPPPTGGRRKYPFAAMEVGDSFMWTGNKARIASAAFGHGIRKGMKFSCLTVEGGTRVWRTA